MYKCRKMKVLREKRTHKPLNVAFTEDGLKWTTNKLGKALYYKKAIISNGVIRGDLRPSDKVYIEDFVPNLNPKNRYLKFELEWLRKAQALEGQMDYTNY